MTTPKTLTPAEALRALSEGERLTCIGWAPTEFIQLCGTRLIDECGTDYIAEDFANFIEYTEPKPKRKVAPYYVRDKSGVITLEDTCFETDQEAKEYYRSSDFTVEELRRCTALEVEYEG